MAESKITLRKIRAGLYEVGGVKHRCKPWSKDAPAGVVRIERVSWGHWRWESFCTLCKACDCDGWPTLAEAVQNVRGFCDG